MASTIIIKNGAGSSTPSSLKQGELAINVDNGKLFYGTSGSSNAVSSSFSFQHITASGEISASKVIADTISGGVGQNGLTLIGNITASGIIDASTNKIVFGDPEGNVGGHSIELDQTNANALTFNIQSGGQILATTNKFTLIDQNGDNNAQIILKGDISASGHVSASGTGSFRALNITDDGVAKFNVDTNGHVTASGTGSFTGGVESTTTGSFGHLFVNGTINIPVIGNDPAGIIQVNGVNYISGTTNDLNVGNTSKILDLRGTNVIITGSISSSADISATGNISASGTGSFRALNITDDGVAKFNVDTNGHVSASGDISSSGGMIIGRDMTLSTNGVGAFSVISNGVVSASGLIQGTAFKQENNGNLTFVVDTSGNVSSSGTLSGTALTLASNGVNVATIDTSGNISSSAALFGTGLNLRQAGVHKVSLNPEGNGNIAAEGFISSSGVLSGTSLTLATNGSTRASINASGEITSGNISSSGVLNANTVQLAHNGINTLNVSNAGAISASSTIQGTAFTAQTNGVTTATIDASGNISSSGGTITTSTLVGHGTTTEFAVNGDISSSATLLGTDLDIRSAGVQKAFIDTDGTGSFTHISASQLFIHDTDAGGGIHLFDNDGNNIAAFARVGSGDNAHRGRMVLRDNADIKVEITSTGTSFVTGDFSSSAALKGNTAQFANNGINTLNISNAGAISASSTIQGTALTLQDAGINTLTVDTIGNVSSSATGSFRALTIADDGVTQAAIDANGVVTGSAFHGTQHILYSGTIYINDDPLVQNSLYLGNSVGNQDSNWNDPQAAGGTLGSTSTVSISEDDTRWGMILPFDVSKVEIQCSIRPGGACSGDNFFVGLYTAARPNNSADANYNITLVAHNDSTFQQGKYTTNDFTHTANLDKGSLIFVGIGSEDATAAKNAPGILNVIITQR